MTTARIEEAAHQFVGRPSPIRIESLGNGLIHHTYHACVPGNGKSFVLQAINTNVFKEPSDIIHNYLEIYECLQKKGNGISIPTPIRAANGQWLWEDEKHTQWRANCFIDNSHSPLNAANETDAYTVALSFGKFTGSLSGIDTREMKQIIPDFHNLGFRYRQLEEAIAQAPLSRLIPATHIIAELRERKNLLDFYESIQQNAAYPDRVMHHDCKISNILFDKNSGKVICPVDLDTTMPGKFFSDLGDMIRSMACTVDENSVSWEEIDIRPEFYKSILSGYLEGVGNIFTKEEINNIHYAGLLMIYMQSIRFLADYLNGNLYYKTKHPDQNLDRALNQLILLQKLEAFLLAEYQFSA